MDSVLLGFAIFIGACALGAAFFAVREPAVRGTRFIWTLPILGFLQAGAVLWTAHDLHQFPLVVILIALTVMELTASVKNTAAKRGYHSVDEMVRDKAKRFQ